MKMKETKAELSQGIIVGLVAGILIGIFPLITGSESSFFTAAVLGLLVGLTTILVRKMIQRAGKPKTSGDNNG